MKIYKSHPRYASLKEREVIVKGIAHGITSLHGLIAQGRGEAFDYLLGEKTQKFAKEAEKAAAAALLLAKKPVISVNGNTAVLCPKEIIILAKVANAEIEVNLFHNSAARRIKIAKLFKGHGAKILGVGQNRRIPGLKSSRGKVEGKGIYSADLVLLAIEDGDRTEALKRMKKKVIAIDLNPLSRTARKANITVVDNVTRAIPEIGRLAKKLKRYKRHGLELIVGKFNNHKNLKLAEKLIRQNIGR